MQIIYNMLEQDPGRAQIAACREAGATAIARVPHSSGLLEGHYTAETTFDENDHRRHRPRSWLINGLKKIEQLQFLLDARPGATLGQVALRWILSDPTVASTLPNIYNREQLVEFCGAASIRPFDAAELVRVQALYDSNFGLPEAAPEAADNAQATEATEAIP
jgi:aryl-alcohol dehydrogenase-like predicted oxidoreductase